MNLSDLMFEDAEVMGILKNKSIGHKEAASQISEKGHPTTESSVRRARKNIPVTVAVIGDYQIGKHDRKFIDRQCEIIRDLKPDMIVSTGDEVDFTQISRHVKGLPGEYEGLSLDKERQIWVEIAKQINEAAPEAEKRMCASNHLRRLPAALERYLPGLRDLPELAIPTLLKLEELGWTWDPVPTEILPGVVYSHGDEFMVTTRTQQSKTREVIKTRRANVIYGHSHQAGLATTALGYGYNMETFWSLNVGHGMQVQNAEYVKSTSPDWSRGIGVVHWDGSAAHPELHLEINGKIRVNGRTY